MNTTRKPHEKRLLKPKIDLFTSLCRSALGVEMVKELQFHPTRRWRFDYAIPTFRIALEVEGGIWTGGRHVRGKGFLGDMDKYNTAALMGWCVLRVTPTTLHTGATLDMLRVAIKARQQQQTTK